MHYFWKKKLFLGEVLCHGLMAARNRGMDVFWGMWTDSSFSLVQCVRDGVGAGALFLIGFLISCVSACLLIPACVSTFALLRVARACVTEIPKLSIVCVHALRWWKACASEIRRRCGESSVARWRWPSPIAAGLNLFSSLLTLARPIDPVMRMRACPTGNRYACATFHR
jgi:hypothetical protein